VGDLSKHKLRDDPRFLERIEKARASIRAGKGVPLEDIEAEDDGRTKPSHARRKQQALREEPDVAS